MLERGLDRLKLVSARQVFDELLDSELEDQLQQLPAPDPEIAKLVFFTSLDPCMTQARAEQLLKDTRRCCSAFERNIHGINQ